MRFVCLVALVSVAACGGGAARTTDLDALPVGAGDGGEAGEAVITGKSGSRTVTSGGTATGSSMAAGAGAGGDMASSGAAGDGTGGRGGAGSEALAGGGAGGDPGAGAGAGGSGEAGGASGEAGSSGVEGGAGGQSPVVDPWKECDGSVCGENEVCVHDSPTHRVCAKIKDEFGRCDPTLLPNPGSEQASCCAGKSIACSTIYFMCGMMDDPATGESCGMCSDGLGRRWHCGPPVN